MTNELTFAEQTRLPEWRMLREKIIMKQGFICHHCLEGAILKPKRFYITARFYDFFTKQSEPRYYPIFYNPNIRVTSSHFIECKKMSREERDGIKFASFDSFPYIIGIDRDRRVYITLWSKTIEADDWIQNDLVYIHTYKYENTNIYFLTPQDNACDVILPLIRFCTTTDAEAYPITSNSPSDVYQGPILQVHHKYYIKDKPIWEVPEGALITLCRDCHIKEHKSKKIPIYNRNPKPGENSLEYYHYEEPCRRCSGRRYFQEYKHVNNGRCFRCGGYGYEYIEEPDNDKLLIMSKVDYTNRMNQEPVLPPSLLLENDSDFDNRPF